jgi:hypothetical protein
MALLSRVSNLTCLNRNLSTYEDSSRFAKTHLAATAGVTLRSFIFLVRSQLISCGKKKGSGDSSSSVVDDIYADSPGDSRRRLISSAVTDAAFVGR